MRKQVNEAHPAEKEHTDSLKVVIIGCGAAAIACAAHAAEENCQVTIIEHTLQRGSSELPYLQTDSETKIALIQGRAYINDTQRVSVFLEDGAHIALEADRILIASDTIPYIPAVQGISGVPYWNVGDALKTQDLLEHLVILGFSSEAVDLALSFCGKGTRVSLVMAKGPQAHEEPLTDHVWQEVLECAGIEIYVCDEIKSVRYIRGLFYLTIATPKGDSAVTGDRLVIDMGSVANTDGLGLHRIGVDTDASGAIKVDDGCRTTTKYVYAAGDCCTLPKGDNISVTSGTLAAINMTGANARLELSVRPPLIVHGSVENDEPLAHESNCCAQ